MKSMKMEEMQIHLLKLEKGDELLSSILIYCKEHNIVAGYLSGLGALEKGKIGYFDVVRKEYLYLSFLEVELLSCTGNISKNKDTDEPVAHIHITIGYDDGRTIGGHLFEGIVSVTAEIYLVETRPGVFRVKDETTGLYLLNPKN